MARKARPIPPSAQSAQNEAVRPGSLEADALAREAAQTAFLDALEVCGNITDAAKAAGIGRRTHYDWLEQDAAYATRYNDALRGTGDTLLREMWRRAIEGVETPVFGAIGQGQGTGIVGHVMKKSDGLLERLGKAFNPQLFAERHAHEHTGKDGKPIAVEHTTDAYLEKATDEQVERLNALWDEIVATAQAAGSAESGQKMPGAHGRETTP